MATRQLSLRLVTRNGKRPCIRYKEDDGSFTYYPTLGYWSQPSGFPPNVSRGRFSDSEWSSLWFTNRLNSSNYDNFDTPDGPKVMAQLLEGDAYEDSNRRLIVRIGRLPQRPNVVIDAADWGTRQGEIVIRRRSDSWPARVQLIDGRIEVTD